MSKLNILWASIDRSYRVAGHFDDLKFEFKKLANIKEISHNPNGEYPGAWIKKILDGKIKLNKIVEKELNSGNNYDAIFCDSLFAYGNENWKSINIPKFMILEDQHSYVPKMQVDLAKKYNFICLHRYQLNKFHKNLNNHIKCIWFPHSVNTKIFKDYHLDKNIGILQYGAISKVYETRNFAKNHFSNYKFYKFIKRPKETDKVKWPIRDDLARLINSSNMSVACGSIYQYPVMKYFEIPACGSIIFGEWFHELAELGFKRNFNFVELNRGKYDTQINNLLKNKERLNIYSKNGLKLIQKRHSNVIRAKDLDRIIRKEIK